MAAREKNAEASKSSMRNVFALGFVSFFTDVSSEMVFSLLPAFLLVEIGASRAVLGVVEGLAESLSYVLRMVSGVISDRFRRRKPLVFIGYALSTAVKPLFAVAHTWIEVLAIRISDRVGKGVRTSPRDALLSESVAEKRMGVAFGLHRTLDQLGAIIGPLIASALMLFFAFTARDVFWVSFIPGSIALAILVFLVKEREGASRKARLLGDVRRVFSGNFPWLLLSVAVFSLGAFNFSFVLAKAEELNVHVALIPIVYAVINVSHTAVAIPSGVLSDKIGKEKVLIVGYAVFAVSAFLLWASNSQWCAFLVAVVYGVYMGIVETVQRALIPKYAPKELRGTAYGLYYLTAGSCFLVANIVVGALWDTVGIMAAATYSITTTIIAIAGLSLLLLRKPYRIEA